MTFTMKEKECNSHTYNYVNVANGSEKRCLKKMSLHLQVVERLSVFIDSYKSVLVKETNVPLDSTGFPYHFNNTWIPWLPDDYQSISEMHFTTNTVTSCDLKTLFRPRVSAEEFR